MATDIIEMALASALEELETFKKTEEEQKHLLQNLMEKINEMEKRVKDTRPLPPQPINTAPLEAAFTKAVTRLQQMVEAQPKNVVHERRILLFPEYNAREYYRLVLRRLFFWIIIVLLSTYLYVLGKQAIQTWYVIHSQQKEMDEYKRAWQQLYLKEEKKEKRK